MNSYTLVTILILYLACSNVNALMCYVCNGIKPAACADIIIGDETYTKLLKKCDNDNAICKYSQEASNDGIGSVKTIRGCVDRSDKCTYKNTFYSCCHCRLLGCNGDSLCNASVPSKAVGRYNKLSGIVLVPLVNIMAALN